MTRAEWIALVGLLLSQGVALLAWVRSVEKRIDRTHTGVFGNGDPPQGLVNRVARIETELKALPDKLRDVKHDAVNDAADILSDHELRLRTLEGRPSKPKGR